MIGRRGGRRLSGERSRSSEGFVGLEPLEHRLLMSGDGPIGDAGPVVISEPADPIIVFIIKHGEDAVGEEWPTVDQGQSTVVADPVTEAEPEALIGFEQGNIRAPIVIGGMWTATDEPPADDGTASDPAADGGGTEVARDVPEDDGSEVPSHLLADIVEVNPASVAPKTKEWLCSSFRFEVGDLPCSRIAKVDSFGWEQGVVKDDVGAFREPMKEPAKVEVPNLKVTISMGDLLAWSDWHGSFVTDGVMQEGGLDAGKEVGETIDIINSVRVVHLENSLPSFFAKAASGMPATAVAGDTDSGRQGTVDCHLPLAIPECMDQGGGTKADQGDARDDAGWEGQIFECIPAATVFRPGRTTPKLVAQGPQTAVVVGPSGEEIFTDKYGRVKVQFHWDREGKKEENSSCWMRVSQIHAGKGWGGITIPRVGQDVVSEPREGHPDRPIVTGRVYHGDGAVGGGHNEILIDDTKGKEFVRAHGRSAYTDDHQVRKVTNNETIQIGNDRTETVAEADVPAVRGPRK